MKDGMLIVLYLGVSVGLGWLVLSALGLVG